jgi:hypothetical protein
MVRIQHPGCLWLVSPLPRLAGVFRSFPTSHEVGYDMPSLPRLDLLNG